MASAARCPEGALARPRFSAGQLLTQEDLQLVVDYVVGKNRLRNRYLFGEGVVCGLNVTCAPCGGGNVTVAPGYALDCCGNDVHVPCPVELDINALGRELRLKQLEGWDCGDPCASQRCDDPEEAPVGESTTTAGAQREPSEQNDARHYCLYLKYREVLSDPIAPYVSDSTCGSVTCEPTRVCETYAFELRCATKPAPADLLERIKARVGDLSSLVKTTTQARINAARSLELRRAAQLATAAKPALRAADLTTLEAASNRLKQAKLGVEGADTPDEHVIRRYLADYQLLATSLARIGKPDKENKRAAEALKEARSVLGDTQEPLSALARKLGEPTARDAAGELFALSSRYALSTPAAAAAETAEAKLFRAGAPFSLKQLFQLRSDSARIKQWLLERLDRSDATSCELRDRLLAVRIGESDELDLASATRSARASEELAMILLEYLRDCLCLALSPTCTPCDDAAVLLACVDVRDCKVIDVCNMSRRLVLSPANLRYWLPPIGLLGKLIERFCCELELRVAPVDDPRYYDEQQPALSAERSFFRTSAVPELPAELSASNLSLLAAAVGVPVSTLEQVAELARQLGALGSGSVRNAPRRRA